MHTNGQDAKRHLVQLLRSFLLLWWNAYAHNSWWRQLHWRILFYCSPVIKCDSTKCASANEKVVANWFHNWIVFCVLHPEKHTKNRSVSPSVCPSFHRRLLQVYSFVLATHAITTSREFCKSVYIIIKLKLVDLWTIQFEIPSSDGEQH